MDFGPSSKQAFGTWQSKTWIVNCSQLLQPISTSPCMRERKPTQLWCILHLNFSCSQYPISQVWGRWGGSSYWFLIGNPGHQKKVRLQKSWNFTQTSKFVCFTQRPVTKNNQWQKFQVNSRDEQTYACWDLLLMLGLTHLPATEVVNRINLTWAKKMITISHIVHRQTPKVLHQKWKCVLKRLDPTNPFGSRGPLPVNQPYQISPPSLGNLLINP